MGVLDRLNEAPGLTDCNAKDLCSLQYTVAKKNLKKKPWKNSHFGKITV